jgi:hypothetical protein
VYQLAAISDALQGRVTSDNILTVRCIAYSKEYLEALALRKKYETAVEKIDQQEKLITSYQNEIDNLRKKNPEFEIYQQWIPIAGTHYSFPRFTESDYARMNTNRWPPVQSDDPEVKE